MGQFHPVQRGCTEQLLIYFAIPFAVFCSRSGEVIAMEQAAVQIGSVLAGRYRIDRVLGQGGMGIVVQATHLQLHQPVAIKFLLPEVLGNQQVVQRFVREAQAAVRLRSEHVARVIDVGTLETGAPYMVLEYLDGSDLSNFPRNQLTVGRIVDLVLQACEALAEAHSLGIVHRDIKPANFFVTWRADGTPLLKVLDFGISKMPAGGDSSLTATQTVMGTPAYMSPEQMKASRDVDHRSDIWSLGIVLYELLQGAPPFGGETFSAMILKVVTEPLPRLAISLPGDLDSVIYRCLEKDPARRFQNVGELAQALARYASSTTQAAISVQRTGGITGITGASHSPSTLSGAVHASTTPPVGGRRWPIFAGVGVLAAGVGVTLLLAGGGSSRAPQELGASRPVSDRAATAPPPTAVPTPPPSAPATTTSTRPPTSPRLASPMTRPSPTPPPPTPRHRSVSVVTRRRRARPKPSSPTPHTILSRGATNDQEPSCGMWCVE
jgi:eukaryotic-like serine/threonine-protein kinase